MKNWIALLLASLLAFGGSCLAAEWGEGLSAARPYSGVGEVNLELTMGYMVLTPRVKLPATITEIHDGLFNGCAALEEITLPDGIEAIGNNAFNGCRTLAEMTLPEGLRSIGDSAFSGCELMRRVMVPNSVDTILDTAFTNCNAEIYAACNSYAHLWIRQHDMNGTITGHVLDETRETKLRKKGKVIGYCAVCGEKFKSDPPEDAAAQPAEEPAEAAEEGD